MKYEAYGGSNVTGVVGIRLLVELMHGRADLCCVHLFMSDSVILAVIGDFLLVISWGVCCLLEMAQ